LAFEKSSLETISFASEHDETIEHLPPMKWTSNQNSTGFGSSSS
jgi:hypothetical protein